MATTRTDFGTFPDTATSVDFRAMTGTRLSPYRVAMSGACIAFNHPPTAPWGVHGGRTRVAFFGVRSTPIARPRAAHAPTRRFPSVRRGIAVRADRRLGLSGRSPQTSPPETLRFPLPRGRPTAKLPHHHGSRFVGLPEQPPGEKVQRSARGLLSAARISSKNSPLDLGR